MDKNLSDHQASLNWEIAALESKIQDTKYFIETALCRETQMIYKGVLNEQVMKLNALLAQKNKISDEP